MKIKLFTAPSEINASIIKGTLENVDIKTSIGPGEGSLNFNTGSKGPNAPYDVWAEDKDLEKARDVLKESGCLSDVK